MKHIIPAFILVLQVLCASALPVSAYTYAVDDGTAENALGLTGGGNVWWANGFTAQAGAETITTVQIAFSGGSLTVGMPFKVMVYEDPDDDGDPGTGPIALLAEADATIVDPSGGTFQDIAIGPATVAGKFFVAALINHASAQHPATFDQTTSAGVSWVAGSSPAAIDPSAPFTPAPDLGPDLIGNFGLPGNFLLRAVGGHPVGLSEDFEGAFPPAGWTIVHNISSCDWESTATTGRSNTSGGSGQAADADSDWCGTGMNTELQTPVFSLAGLTAPVLQFRSKFSDFNGNDHGYVDISTNGGATWTNLLHYDGVDVGPLLETVDLSVYAGQTSVMIRFHYVAPGWDWYWLVDDVFIGEVLPPTPAATTQAATAVGTASATLNGQVNANGASTTVTFEYGPTAAYGSIVTATQSPVTGAIDTAVSANIAGLASGVTYHFRVVAQNANGTTYGGDLTFTTGAIFAPLATTQTATAIGTASATLNGQVNANGDSTTVTFEYGPTAAYGSIVTATQSPVTGAIDTAVSVNIAGLASGVTYHFRLVAQNAGGTTYGGDLTFTTGAIPVTTAITRLATAVDLISATLNGLVNAIGYDTTITFEYGLDTNYGHTITAIQSPINGYTGTLVSAKITDLIPGATYHFRVVAENSTGIIYGADLTFTAGAPTTRVYVPHINVTGGWQTQIGLVNTSIDRTITGRQTAFDSAGGNVGTGFFTLAPNGRIEIDMTNGSASHAGIDFIADPGTILGYTKFYRQGICRAAIPMVLAVNTGDIYIPHIASNDRWWTGICLTNTEAEAKIVTLVFNDGRSVVRTIPANGYASFTIADLFDGRPQPGIQSGVITNAAGLIGLEMFGSADGGLVEGLLLTDKAFSTLYYPHVACPAKWWTGVVAYNPWDEDCDITLTSYDENGVLLFVANDSIPARTNYVRMVKHMGLPDATAWFKIEGSLPLVGFELFGTLDNRQLAAYAGSNGTGANKGAFAKIEKNGWTGLCFINTEAEEASVTLSAYDDTGNWISITTIKVSGHAKVVGLAENIFSQDISQATYIGYTADKNIVGFQLSGTSDGAMLDGLPVLY